MIDALEELRTLKQWVAWKKVWDAKREAITKPPINVYTDEYADKTNPEHWTSYDEAMKYAMKMGFIVAKNGGVGFVFTENDSYAGIDLDYVVNDDGSLTPEAAEIVALMDSYTEYSVSGKGLHILVKLNEPLANFCTKHKVNLGIASRIEIYDSRWYFTFSGQVYGEPKPIAERTEQCRQVCAKFMTQQVTQQAKESAQPAATAPSTKGSKINWKYNPAHYTPESPSPVVTRSEDLSDSELWERMFNSQNGADIQALYNGDISAYDGDHSRADLALCSHLAYWTNGDASRIDRMFRMSGLMRDKWERSDYRERTIAQALTNSPGGSMILSDSSTSGNNSSGEKNDSQDSTATGNSSNSPDSESIAAAQSESESNHRRGALLSAYLAEFFQRDLAAFALYKKRKTGFDNLDKFNSLYPGLYVIGGVSGVGKTTFIHQIADNLARAGEFVLFFSLEQTRLELASKGIARITALNDFSTAKSSLAIRNGSITEPVERAIRMYQNFAQREYIFQAKFGATVDSVIKVVEEFIVTTGKRPIVIIDYLQILRPSKASERRSKGTREAVDDTVHALKKLQADKGLVMFLVSSFNRQNYLTTADFESFKESGLIEYSADVVWALQLLAMNANIFNTDSKTQSKRNFVHEAKNAEPRKIELITLKNRYGRSFCRYFFNYYAKFDLFEVYDIDEQQADQEVQEAFEAFDEKHGGGKKSDGKNSGKKNKNRD